MSNIINYRNYGCKGKPYFQYSQTISEENVCFLRKYPLFVHFLTPFGRFSCWSMARKGAQTYSMCYDKGE